MVLQFERSGRKLTVYMQGELDHHNVSKVKTELDNRLQDRAITTLVFDFKSLSLMDSSGIGLIIGRYKMMQQRSGSVAVRAPSRAVDRIMAMSGLYKIIQKIG